MWSAIQTGIGKMSDHGPHGYLNQLAVRSIVGAIGLKREGRLHSAFPQPQPRRAGANQRPRMCRVLAEKSSAALTNG